MEHRPVVRVHSEVERMALRPPRDHVLWRLRHDPRNATVLPIRILVHTKTAWVQRASRVRSGNDLGCGIQLKSRSANGNSICFQQVSPS